MSSAPVVFGEFILSDALDKTKIKLVSLKMQLGWETVSFYHVDTSLFSIIFDVDSIGPTSSK